MSEFDCDNVEEAMALTQAFVEKHGVEELNQALMLGSEVGELQEAVLMDDREGIREEIGDVIFVVYTIAYLEGIDPWVAFRAVARDNIGKDSSTEGGKVTKDKYE